MYNVVTGPFHPFLESALVDEIRQLKSSDPLAPLAIVVPSDLLRRRVQWLLCVEHHSALLDVHFLTFHQLALRLYDEHILFNQDSRIARIDMAHDLFFERLLHSIATRNPPGLDQLKLSRLTAGSWTALWNTIRDVKEAMVDPKVVLQGVHEGLFEDDDRNKLQALFTLYAMVLEASKALNVGSADDIAAAVVSRVPGSEFLGRLQRVCYYGFYDLTQVQLSLFEAITTKTQVTVYFPLADDPAFAFARRFFERHLSPGVLVEGREERTLPESVSGSGSAQPQQIMVMNTVGSDDELVLVCKEILNLVETHGYNFNDIGVVSRSLEPYQSSLRRTFDQHRIPFTTSAMIPVVEEPAIKLLVQLAGLPLTEFYWRDVLDILVSPYYRVDRHGVKREDMQPELWHAAVGTIGIDRGEDEWERLQSVSQMGLESAQHEHEDDSKSRLDVDPAQVRLLYRLVTQLIADCRALPVQGSYGNLTEAFISLVHTHLALPGMEGPHEAAQDLHGEETLGALIQKVFNMFSQFDRVQDSVTWKEWTRLFGMALSRCHVPIESGNHQGVRVLDAMSARGLPFRAVFLIGLNEKQFPRFIREDAFLRDRHRRVLEETFGYKIDQKLAGYDEEQLLFALMKHAAQRRFYLVYQRADEEGRPLALSPYLSAIQSIEVVAKQNQELTLPRRFSDRMDHPLFGSQFLTKEELGIKLVVQGFDPSSLLQAAGREPYLFRHGWEAIKKIERHGRRLGPHDGLLGSLDAYWQQITEEGLTPTSLEMYARCPFQYFAKHILRIRPIRSQVVKELSASSLGELCHALLRASYRQLTEAGWPTEELSLTSIRQTIASAGDEVFTRYAADRAIGYFLTWQLAKDQVIQLVTSVVEADQQVFRENGYRPVAFEVEAGGRLEGFGLQYASLKIRGRVDRIDQRDDPARIRIVDYKFQSGSRMESKFRNLLLSGIRGFSLQPPLYSLMTEFHDPIFQAGIEGHPVRPERVEFVFLAPRWEINVDRSGFDSASWKGRPGGQLKKTVRTLVNGIHAGQYFIFPDGYCKNCDFSTACRRFHGPTRWRAYRSSPGYQLRRLRKQDVSSD